jgi:hypothetical protein
VVTETVVNFLSVITIMKIEGHIEDSSLFCVGKSLLLNEAALRKRYPGQNRGNKTTESCNLF